MNEEVGKVLVEAACRIMILAEDIKSKARYVSNTAYWLADINKHTDIDEDCRSNLSVMHGKLRDIDEMVEEAYRKCAFLCALFHANEEKE